MSSPYTYLRARLAAIQPTRAWKAGEPDWANETRRAIRKLVGVVDEPFPSGEPVFGEPIHEERYVRRWVSFPSRDGWDASGWLLTPNGAAEAPGVICLPGHGEGADAIVGLVEEPYQAKFALQCVRRGWVALALEQVSFGKNMSEDHGDDQSSCLLDSMFTLQLGETMTGWRVRDAIAAARFLCTLPQVNKEKIATLGISGGGLTALWAAALDESICAAGVSGYFTPMAHSILKYRHCADNYVPGLAHVLDVPDLAGLMVPRWLAVENGREDHIFAIEGFRSACIRAQQIYESHGCAERFASIELEAGHVFEGANIFAHFASAFDG